MIKEIFNKIDIKKVSGIIFVKFILIYVKLLMLY